MVDFVFYYILAIVLFAWIAYIISAWRQPISVSESIKERASSVVIFAAVLVAYNVVDFGTEFSKWQRFDLLLAFTIGAALCVAIDWWLIRRREQREAV